MWWRRVTAVLAALFALLTLPAPGPARAVCESPPGPGRVIEGTPVEGLMFAPERLSAVATGAGVRVAVIDSGVDARHPQLRGRVARGADFLRGAATGREDCAGHGTAVASLIAAAPAAGTGFQGLAPGAVIVPIRISEQLEIDGKEVGDGASAGEFADAIDFARTSGADVINLSLVMTSDSEAVHDAVDRAVAAGIVVVAAVGNRGAAKDGNPTPYPAAYDGVIGVGAVTAEGVRADFSQHGRYVDVVAPGAAVTVATRVSGHQVSGGTSFAAPFVSATAALIKERFPDLTPAQVEQRLTATTDPAPAAGARSDDYGYGLLNPFRAVTEELGPATRPAPAPVVLRGDDPAAVALAERRARSRDLSLIVAGAGFGLVLAGGAVALVVRHGRRRRWRPGEAGAGYSGVSSR